MEMTAQMQSILKALTWVGIAILTWLLLIEWPNYAPNLIQPKNQSQIQSESLQSNSDAQIVEAGAPQVVAPQSENKSTNAVLTQNDVIDSSTNSEYQSLQASPPPLTKEIEIETDTLLLTVSLLNGDILTAKLKKFPLRINEPLPYTLLNGFSVEEYYIKLGMLAQSIDFTSSQQEWVMAEDDQTLTVVLTGRTADNIAVTRSYIFNRGEYLIKVSDNITNDNDRAIAISPYSAIYHSSSESAGTDGSSGLAGTYTFYGAAWYSQEAPYNKESIDDLTENPSKFKVQGGWISFLQHYFLSAIIPNKEHLNSYQTRYLEQSDTHILGVVSPTANLNQNDFYEYSFDIYLGPKDQYSLETISKGLELTVDYGWLWWLGQPLFFGMYHIEKVVGNWGLAIILLTFFIKLIIFPISAMGYKSMAKMRLLAPQLEAINKRNTGDRQKIATETLELYKAKGVNPLGGCLPMLVPIPVFLALYWVLLESVELRQAPLALWIQDLSAPDPFYILPIFMGISMFLVQKLSPTPSTIDPIQKKILQAMPIVFTVFSLFFPSGLVLYWLVNNVLSLAQQWYIYRQLGT